MNNLKTLQELGLYNRITDKTLKDKIDICNKLSIYNSESEPDFCLDQFMDKYKRGCDLYEISIMFYQENFHFDFVREMKTRIDKLKQSLIDLENVLLYEYDIDVTGECVY